MVLGQWLKELKNTDVVVCPPFPFIFPLAKLDSPKNLFLGSQIFQVK